MAEAKRKSPVAFFREVRQEARKVTWTSRRETGITTVMVFIMATVAALFFLLVDQILGRSINAFLNLF